MNLKEAHNLVTQLDRDLAAEPDPAVRAWYETETKLQPDYQLARQTLAEAAAVAGLIGRVAELKAAGAETPAQTDPDVLPDGTVVEQPPILTPEELLNRRLNRKFNSCYKQYLADLDAITAPKKSKREHQEMLVRRQFARRFNDFSDVSGDQHIAMRADLLGTVAAEICPDEALLDEIFANSAQWAQRHSAEVTADTKNFAGLIAGLVPGRAHADQFEKIIRGLFSADPESFAGLHTNLAHASFELLDDPEALREVMDIVYLRKPYVPLSFTLKAVEHRDRLLAGGDVPGWLDYIQITAIQGSVNYDITGQKYVLNPQQEQAIKEQVRQNERFLLPTYENLPDDQKSIINLANPSLMVYDPVEAVSLADGEAVDLKHKAMPDELRRGLESSPLFRKRMEQLAPYTYAARAAKEILGSPGTHGLLIPLSPGITADVYFPMLENRPLSPEEYQRISDRIYEISNHILQTAADAPALGMRSYGQAGAVRMIYHPLFEDEKDGIVIYRPSIPLDKKTHSAVQLLALNYAAIRGIDVAKGNVGEAERLNEKLQEQNEMLRQAIKAEQSRFLGRRPIKFSMPPEYKKVAGLFSVSLRHEPKLSMVKALLQLDDGQVELDLDEDFHIRDERKVSLVFPETGMFYENLALKLARKWSCSQEVHTSEGTISERSGNSANFGHFAYLRVREDGYKYNFSEAQRLAFLAERRGDLAAESARRKLIDKTGRQRNSTYVRENYDPAKPALEVYYSSLD